MTLHDQCALRKKARLEGWLWKLDKGSLPEKARLSPSQRFIRSKEWKNLRPIVFDYYGRRCMKCGCEEKLQIDHIKPRSDYPELALDFTNLQVLCWSCNKAKGKDIIDYRFKQT